MSGSVGFVFVYVLILLCLIPTRCDHRVPSPFRSAFSEDAHASSKSDGLQATMIPSKMLAEPSSASPVIASDEGPALALHSSCRRTAHAAESAVTRPVAITEK